MQQFLRSLKQYCRKEQEKAVKDRKSLTDEGLECMYWEACGRQKAYESILERLYTFSDF